MSWRVAVVLVMMAASLVGVYALQKPEPNGDLEAALQKATVEGKYRMLLHQFKAVDDQKTHGDFKDLGYQEVASYGTHSDLPAGHWVYVAPYWYIWRDTSDTVSPRRPWGPEQVIGKPDVFPQAGDFQQAWASLSEDAQDEWLLLEYERPLSPRSILVYETYNPGAVTKITAFKLDGEEVVIWKGKDPSPVGSGKGLSVIPVRVPFKITRLKVYLASIDIGGWNEIDAVGLRDAQGKTHWATSVASSTTYASVSTPAPPVVADEARVKRLEKEVEQLKVRAQKLEERLKKKTAP